MRVVWVPAGLRHSIQGTLNCLFLGIHVIWNCETEQCIKVHVSNRPTLHAAQAKHYALGAPHHLVELEQAHLV